MMYDERNVFLTLAVTGAIILICILVKLSLWIRELIKIHDYKVLHKGWQNHERWVSLQISEIRKEGKNDILDFVDDESGLYKIKKIKGINE